MLLDYIIHTLNFYAFFLSFLLAPLWGVFLALLIAFGRRHACQTVFRLAKISGLLALGFIGLGVIGSLLQMLHL